MIGIVTLSILSLISCQRYHIEQDQDGIVKTKLKNGLTLIIQEDHTSPIVTLMTRVLTGYLDEKDEESGLSHIVEHMILKGTEKRKSPQLLWQEIRSYGADWNAWTSYDESAFLLTLPSRYFEQGLELHVDAVMNPLFDPTELAKETEIIIQESKQRKDSPIHFVDETLKGISFQDHRLKRWRMGEDKGLRQFTREDATLFHQKHYRPSNMIVTVVGDIDARQTLKAIDRTFKSFTEESLARDPKPEEPSQSGMRYQRLWGDIRNSYLSLGFHSPPIFHSDHAALEIMTVLLGQGRSSRLTQTLKSEKELVTQIQSYLEAYRDSGFFSIVARLPATHLYAAEIAILNELERLKSVLVSAKELDKIKNQLETQLLLSEETTDQRASRLSHYEQYGALMRKHLENLGAVTPEDIRRVAQTYFKIDHLSLLEYVARGEKPHTYPKKQLEVKLNENVSFFTKKLPPSLETNRVQEVSEVKASSSKELLDVPVKKYELSNKATVILKESHAVPLVALTLYFKGGRAFETRKNSGITELLLRSSLTGTTTRDEKEIIEGLDQAGAILTTLSDYDFFGYQLTVHKKNIDLALKILSDIVLHPSFSIQLLNREKQELLADIDQLEDNPLAYSSQLFREAALKTHPYGLPDLGLKWSVIRLTPDQLVSWHQQMVSSHGMVMGIVGDFDSLEMRASLENYFKQVPLHPLKTPPPEEVTFPSFISENFKRRQKEQTSILIGFEAAPIKHGDRVVLKLLEAFTTGTGGRFGQKLRTEEKLAHVVQSHYEPLDKGGLFLTYASTSAHDERQTLRALLEEMKKLKGELTDKKELQNAKNYCLGQFEMALQTRASQAHFFAKNEIYELPLTEKEDFSKRIDQVTTTDFNEAAIKYFNTEKYTLGIIRGEQRATSIISAPPKPIEQPQPKLPISAQ